MSDVLKSGVLHVRRVKVWSSTCQTCLKSGVLHVRCVKVWSYTCQTY